jgi:hypothetical protein
MADHRYQISVAARLDAEHTESALGIVEGHSLDRAGEHLLGFGSHNSDAGRSLTTSVNEWKGDN